MATAFEVWIPVSELTSSGIYFLELVATQSDGSSPDTMTLWFHHGG